MTDLELDKLWNMQRENAFYLSHIEMQCKSDYNYRSVLVQLRNEILTAIKEEDGRTKC